MHISNQNEHKTQSTTQISSQSLRFLTGMQNHKKALICGPKNLTSNVGCEAIQSCKWGLHPLRL